MDFSKFTREQKEQFLVALEEKKRRDIDARPSFKPHDGQMRVVKSTALERYLFCGNGFGKSTILVNEVHWAASGFNPVTGATGLVPAKICLILDTPEKIDDFLLEYRKWNKLEPEWLLKKGKPYFSFIAYPNGSTVTVLTHQVEPLKLEGSQWTHIFADEPPPKAVFTAVFRGGRIKGRACKVLLAGTPITAAWLRTDVYEPWVEGKSPEVECFEGATDENGDNLEEGWLERFSAKLSDKEREIRLRGRFFDLDGLALSHLFRKKTHTIPRASLDWDPSNPCVIIMDPHPHKAHVALLIGCNQQNELFVLDEFDLKVVARQFMKAIIERGWLGGTYNVIDIVYDSLGSGEMTSGEGYRSFGDVINEVLRESGMGRARATSYDDKSDEDFIERLRDVLVLPTEADSFGRYTPRLRIVAECRKTIDDMERVEWYLDKQIKENKPKLDLRKRDHLACIKYGLATHLFFDKPRRMQPHYVNAPTYGRPLRRGKIALRSISRSRRPISVGGSDDDSDW